MKNPVRVLLLSMVVVFYGCSDSGSSNAPSHSGPATLEDLPNCTDSREGELDTLTDNGYVYRCEDGGWEFVSARLDTAATMDDLSNCTSKLDGDSVLVESENAVFQCRDGRWKKVHGLLVNVTASDDLPACTSKRDEDLAYVADEHSVYGCYDGKWKKLYALMDSVKTADDMSSCNDKREGDSTLVQDENRIYICMTKKWRLLGEVLATEDDMKSCTENREDMRIYVEDIRKSLICRDGKWYSFKLSNLVEEEDEEDEEPAESSSSEEKWEELPSSSSQAKSSSSVASSSSVKSCSSSVKSSSSSVKSSSSVASSSSVKSSSSVTSSSSVVSGSKANWVYLNPDIDYGEFTDSRDGQVYKTVIIGAQTWMAENLNYNYNEGSAKSYCYDNKSENCDKYGRLYTWSAAMDSAAVFSTAGEGCGYGKTCSSSGMIRGVCPEGWHLPSKYEWKTLFTVVGGDDVAGTKLKSIGGWENGGGEDEYGFSALPAGYGYDGGNFDFAGYADFFWTARGSVNDYVAFDISLFSMENQIFVGAFNDKIFGHSVRCLKNTDRFEMIDSRDGKRYRTIKIGNQTWMAENLNYNYNEGSAKSYCYDDKSENCDKYGRLYTWSAAMDSAAVFSTAGEGCGFGKTCNPRGMIRGVCPEGWHLPTYEEWKTLLTEVGGDDVAGKKLKSNGGWKDVGGWDEYDFSALPAGGGYFDSAGYGADFWSASEDGSNYAYRMRLYYDSEYAYMGRNDKYFGYSVRCLQNN